VASPQGRRRNTVCGARSVLRATGPSPPRQRSQTLDLTTSATGGRHPHGQIRVRHWAVLIGHQRAVPRPPMDSQRCPLILLPLGSSLLNYAVSPDRQGPWWASVGDVQIGAAMGLLDGGVGRSWKLGWTTQLDGRGLGAADTRAHSNAHFDARRQDRAFWQTAAGNLQPQVRQSGGMLCPV
jgi:hypothetical protein